MWRYRVKLAAWWAGPHIAVLGFLLSSLAGMLTTYQMILCQLGVALCLLVTLRIWGKPKRPETVWWVISQGTFSSVTLSSVWFDDKEEAEIYRTKLAARAPYLQFYLKEEIKQ